VANRNEAARWARRHGLTERERRAAELPIALTAADGTETARELAGRGSVS
jgi:hypothetical protein